MKLVDVLVDLGPRVPRVPASMAAGVRASATNYTRHLAHLGAVSELADSPPVALHPSKLPTSNLLYGFKRQPDGDDFAYKRGAWAPDGHVLCGAATMQVTESVSRPALVYQHPETRDVCIVVPGAPLAQMENELFGGSETAFERGWMPSGENQLFRSVRANTGAYVRNCGRDGVSDWILSGDYRLERPGPLPLLRLLAPRTSEEHSDLRKAVHCAPAAEVGPLVAGEGPVAFKTVFQRSCWTTEREESLKALENPVVVRTAELLLLYGEEALYYGQPAARGEARGDPELEAPWASAVEAMVTNEQMLLNKPYHARGPRPKPLLPEVFARTGRTWDLEVISRTLQPEQASRAVVSALFGPEDARLVGAEAGSLEQRLRRVARQLCARQVLLLATIDSEEGSVVKCALLGSEGAEWTVDEDDACRLLLCPWCLPLVFDGQVVQKVLARGVVREPARLCDAAREAAREQLTGSIGELAAAARGLSQALPSILDRLGALEKRAAPDSPPLQVDAESTRLFKRARVGMSRLYDKCPL